MVGGAKPPTVSTCLRRRRPWLKPSFDSAHSVNHVSGRLASGHVSGMWLRWTACFQRMNGVWLIVHDHVSVPADLEQGQAALNLTP